MNDQSKIKLIRKYENTRKKIINNECAILFNKTCIYIYIYMYILGCRLRMWNPFLAVGIEKLFFFGIIKNIRKMKISCSITNLTENNLTKFNKSWWNNNLFLVRLKLCSHISRNCGNIACPIPFSDCILSLIHYFYNSKTRCDCQK